MQGVIGLGQCGCNIAQEFEKFGPYDVYYVDTERPGNHFLLEEQATIEEYEKNFPISKIQNFFSTLGKEEILLVIGGSGKISGAALTLLSQLWTKKISVLYVRPDLTILDHQALLRERVVFGVLQEYARSGLFERMYIVDSRMVESAVGEVALLDFFPRINETVAWALHMVNVFNHKSPIYGMHTQIFEVAKIATIGLVDFETGQEKMLFNLDRPRQRVYYYGIREDQLRTDVSLKGKITEQMVVATKVKNVSYGVYTTKYEKPYVFCVEYTSFIQGG